MSKHTDMSLIRLIQESEVIKNGPIFSLKPYDCEAENMKQIIKEKNVIIENHAEKIRELENQVAELEAALEAQQRPALQQMELEERISKLEEYAQMPGLVKKYEKFIADITASYETMKEQRNVANEHLACLECSFADLVTKYERLKNIVAGYQTNQEALLDHIETYKNALNQLHQRYDTFKDYANEKLAEANVHVEKKDKKHISEIAKVKSQVLQSKVKISELEKTITIMTTNTRIGDIRHETHNKNKYPFTPLFNHF